MNPTTEKVFNFLVMFKRENQGNTPTYREYVAAGIVKTHTLVVYHIKILLSQGLIRRDGRNLYIPGYKLIQS